MRVLHEAAKGILRTLCLGLWTHVAISVFFPTSIGTLESPLFVGVGLNLLRPCLIGVAQNVQMLIEKSYLPTPTPNEIQSGWGSIYKNFFAMN